MIGISDSQIGVHQIPLPMHLCIDRLVGQRSYRQAAIEIPDGCLQEVFQDCIFGGGFRVGFEFRLY